MAVRLWIRDNASGTIHEYGSNQHDALVLQEDGSIQYENLCNSCGTMFPKERYTFVLQDGTDPREREDYVKHGVEPYLDIGGVKRLTETQRVIQYLRGLFLKYHEEDDYEEAAVCLRAAELLEGAQGMKGENLDSIMKSRGLMQADDESDSAFRKRIETILHEEDDDEL